MVNSPIGGLRFPDGGPVAPPALPLAPPLALLQRNPELVPDGVNAEGVLDADNEVLTSDVGPLSDEDILAEFRKDNQMEVDDDDEGDVDEENEEIPKRPSKSEVYQTIETFSRYSLFAVEGANIRRHTSQLSFMVDKALEKPKNSRTLKAFSAQ